MVLIFNGEGGLIYQGAIVEREREREREIERERERERERVFSVKAYLVCVDFAVGNGCCD